MPAVSAYGAALDAGASFDDALGELALATGQGKGSPREMVARIGRASRLGERSRGVLDAGATPCWLLMDAMVRPRALLAAG